jgi:cellulose synthase operon protein C
MVGQSTTQELRWRVLLRPGAALISVLVAATAARADVTDLEPWWPGTIAEIGAEIDSLDRGRRLRAVLALAAYTGPEATALLLEAMRDLDAEVRTEAARVLAARGQLDAMATVERWVASGTAAERAAGLEALRLRPALSDAARAAVLRALGDSEPAVRLAALSVIAGSLAGGLAGDRSGEPGETAPRVAFLLDDPTPAVRLQAVRVLGLTGDRRAVLPLLGRLEDPDRQVLREAVSVLGRLGDGRAAGALLRLLEEGPAELRLPVVEAVAALRPADAVPTLARLAARRPRDPLARRAQRALGEIGSAPARSALMALLDGSPLAPELEEALARHAGSLEADLLAALAPGDPRAAGAALVLGRARRARAGPALQRLVSRADPATAAALRALGALGDPDASETLVAAAALPSPPLRRLALEAMLALGDPRTVLVARERIADPDPGVRALAVRLAVRLAPRAPAGDGVWLFRALGDPAPEVRRQAVLALRQLHPPGSVAALLAAWPRLAGLEAATGAALAALATEADVPGLTTLARDGSPSARVAALQGLVTSLAAARTSGTRAPRATTLALLSSLERGGAEAELAAAALAGAGPDVVDAAPALLEATVRRGWQSGAPALRARLCAVLIRRPDLAALLPPALLDAREEAVVQAAAAWALAGNRRIPGAQAALEQARGSTHPAVSANARAALAAAAEQPGPTVRLQLDRPDGGPDDSQPWLVVQAGGLSVWLRGGPLGQVTLPWPGPSPTSLSVDLIRDPQRVPSPPR